LRLFRRVVLGDRALRLSRRDQGELGQRIACFRPLEEISKNFLGDVILGWWGFFDYSITIYPFNKNLKVLNRVFDQRLGGLVVEIPEGTDEHLEAVCIWQGFD